jgi:cell division protein ZapE
MSDIVSLYEQSLAKRGFVADDSQRRAVERLQRLFEDWRAYKARRGNALARMLVKPPLPKGVYLWGAVGRGKSFLMDALYLCVPLVRKRRVHFHHFMREVHREMAGLKSVADPLAEVAARTARRYRLICFDEFHVADIADAMILGRLLSALFRNGVVFVMTTNYAPDGLWPDGIQRERFLPTIALLKEWLDVIEVDAGIDYRFRALEHVEAYHVPLDAHADAALAAAFDAMRAGPDDDPKLMIEGRTITARRRAGSVAWFDFGTLCDGPRSQRDYLVLACRFSVLLVSGIPRMTAEMGDRARRFTWLVDILYDHRVKLLATAAAPPEELYPEGPNSREFARTVSRLAEMQTHDYMSEPHVAAEAPAR